MWALIGNALARRSGILQFVFGLFSHHFKCIAAVDELFAIYDENKAFVCELGL